MQAPLDLELIFPMKDAPSAAFMAIKAVCLHEAGIISKADKLWWMLRFKPRLQQVRLLAPIYERFTEALTGAI